MANSSQLRTAVEDGPTRQNDLTVPPAPAAPEPTPRYLEHHDSPMGWVTRTEHAITVDLVNSQADAERVYLRFNSMVHPGLQAPHQGNC